MEEDKKDKGPSVDDNLNGTLDGDTSAETAAQIDKDDKALKPKKAGGPIGIIKRLASHLNIYMLLFIFILIVAGGITYVAQQSSKKAADQQKAQDKLSADQLSALQNSSTKIGDPKQVLNIESSTIFSGKVLVKDSLDVAGTIHVGGALALPGITVSGTSSFDTIVANSLNVTGNTSVQGSLTVQKGLNVSGPVTFGGPISAPQINIENLQVTKDLLINSHINPTGVTPGKADGGALGAGGTASVNGSDTAGTVTINTGAGAPSGCFVTVNFSQHFGSTPHVVISPVGLGAASLQYYVNRTNVNFSICTANAPPSQTTFFFDYIALD